MPSKTDLLVKAKELNIPESELADLTNSAIQEKIAAALAKKEAEQNKKTTEKDPSENSGDTPGEDEIPSVDEIKGKSDVKVLDKEESPEVALPEKAVSEGKERVKFVEDVNNLYLAGMRITEKKGATREYPKTVALYLRQGGKAI